MKLIFAGAVLACFWTMPAGFARAQAKPNGTEEEKIGEVIIVGNTITQDRVIREVLDIPPGQTLRRADLRVAERNVAKLGLFRVDPKKGIRPTVTVLESPGPCKDILVKVEETHTAAVKPVFVATPRVGVAIAFVVEERNFDLLRFPESLSDIYEGKAFRGGGQTIQFGIVAGPLVSPRFHISLQD